jgi:hypothetical protein
MIFSNGAEAEKLVLSISHLVVCSCAPVISDMIVGPLD